MAKTAKKISISTFDSVMKEYFPSTITEQWFDVEITIKRTLSLKEMLEFVNDVVSSCFQGKDGFMPEVMDFAVKSNILTRYANFSLPDNLEHRYDLVYGTDAVDFVCKHINMNQLNEAIQSINRKIEYLCNAAVAMIQDKMNDLLTAFEDLQKQTEGVFSNLTPDDMKNLVGAITDGGLSEEKIVQAYIDQTKNTIQPTEES